jgi:hypothetical protein
MRRWLSILRYRAGPEIRPTWPFFLFFVGPTVAYLLAVFAGRLLHRGSADQVRYFGTWLQLFGIVLVAQGVRALRREFNRPTVSAAIRARFRAIVQSLGSGDRILEVTAVESVALAESVAVGYGRVGGTTEQRLDGLEREIDDIRKQADERETRLQDKLARLRIEFSKETLKRSEGDADIRRSLDSLAVGGLHLDVIGLWWLLFATIATSVPDGVSWFLHVLSTYIF